jgi:hypothetical protein
VPGAEERLRLKLPADGRNLNDQMLVRVREPAALRHSDRIGTGGEVLCPGVTGALAAVAEFLGSVLGQRRSYLFAPDLASRIFNLTLPAALLLEEPPTTAATRVGLPEQRRGFALIPVVTMLASPRGRSLRRTVTMSFYLLPIVAADRHVDNTCDSESHVATRGFCEVEANSLAATFDWSPARARLDSSARPLTRYRVRGDLATYVSATDVMTLRQVIEHVALTVATRLAAGNTRPVDGRLADEMLRCISLSKSSLVFTWHRGHQRARGELTPARLAEFIVTQQSSLQPPPDIAALSLPQPMIPERIDSYYVWAHSCLVYDLEVDTAGGQPRHPIWNAGYVTYYMLSISALRETVLTLHREAEGRPTAFRMADRLAEVEEFFDLDLAVLPQKRFYDVLLEREGLRADFRNLREKLDVLVSEATIHVQQAQQRSLFLITVVIGAFTVFAAVATVVAGWGPQLRVAGVTVGRMTATFGLLGLFALTTLVAVWLGWRRAKRR